MVCFRSRSWGLGLCRFVILAECHSVQHAGAYSKSPRLLSLVTGSRGIINLKSSIRITISIVNATCQLLIVNYFEPLYSQLSIWDCFAELSHAELTMAMVGDIPQGLISRTITSPACSCSRSLSYCRESALVFAVCKEPPQFELVEVGLQHCRSKLKHPP